MKIEEEFNVELPDERAGRSRTSATPAASSRS